MNEKLYIIHCFQCRVLGKVTIMRFENAFPVTYLSSMIQPQSLVVHKAAEEVYLCQEHYEVIYPLRDYGLELPKN